MSGPRIGDGADIAGDGVYVAGAGKVATLRALKKGGYSLKAKVGRLDIYMSGSNQTALANDFLRERTKIVDAGLGT